MPKHIMITVDWYGPYRSIKQAREAAQIDYDHGLYMCIGRTIRQKEMSLQYVGLASDLSERLRNDHHKLSKIAGGMLLWLGEIATAEPARNKRKRVPDTLNYAEWLHARFLRLPLNEMKTKGLPDRSVTLLNRWWKTDYETMQTRRPHPEWPDLIDFPARPYPARVVWFGGPTRRFDAPDYAKP